MTHVLERIAAIDVGLGDPRAAHNRLVEARQRFLVAAEVLQQGAAVEPVRPRDRIERERAVETLQRLVGQAGIDQDIGAVAVGVGEIGVERDRLVEILDRLHRLAQPVQRLAEQIVHARLRRAERDDAAGELGALLELIVLAGDHGDVIERVGVLRVAAQRLDIALHGLRDIALAVVEQALLDEFGGGRRLAHGRVLRAE